jgi:hypothetical protein
VVQVVDSTTITVEYHRPTARGRFLFGSLVKWDDPWTPGANWATALDVDRDVQVAGAVVPKGRYSLWLVPRERAPWEVILSRQARVWHLWPPPSEDEQVRFAVTARTAPHEEVLTWSFPAIMRDGTILEMRWGATAIAFRVTVQQSRLVQLTVDELAEYQGIWQLEVGDGEDPARAARIRIVEVNGVLQVSGEPVQLGIDSSYSLRPIGGGQFHPIFATPKPDPEAELALTFAFLVSVQESVVLEIRGPEDRRLARGTRVR